MCFAYAKVPILLVSSNYILDDPRANGLTNFTAAVDYITSPTLPTAVGISYCNTGSMPKIYNALGVYNHYPFDDSLYERPYDAYADAIAPVLQEFSDLRQTSVHFDTSCPVCFFQSMPGMQYYLPDDARAVLIYAYHSGTINTKNPSLLALAEQAAQKKIPVYLTGISASSTDYDSKAIYESLGIIPLPEYSPLVAYMYLWYKYSQKH